MKPSRFFRRASGGLLLFQSGIVCVGGLLIFTEEISSQVLGWVALAVGVAGLVQGWRMMTAARREEAMRDPLRIDKVNLGGGIMGAGAVIVCLLSLLGVPGMNWFLVAALTTGTVFGFVLAYIRKR